MNKLIRIIVVLVVLVIAAVVLFSSGGKYPRPTNEYYVNDFANVLLPGTRAAIVAEGERLYELTESEVDGGAQIVFATFSVQTIDEISEYDKTEIFRQWRIGKNDMGVLVLLFFVETAYEDITYLELAECQIEVGYRMEQYLTPAKLGRMIDDYLLNELWEGDLDMGVGNLLFELLREIYTGAYGYLSFNYDMDDFEDDLLTYSGGFDEEMVSMNLVMYLISPYSSFWGKFGSILTLVMLVAIGGGSFIINRGGGGSSGGMGVFRRRR